MGSLGSHRRLLDKYVTDLLATVIGVHLCLRFKNKDLISEEYRIKIVVNNILHIVRKDVLI
jgi:hypothetical protein